MNAKSTAKSALRLIGLFPIARAVANHFSRKVQQSKQDDLAFYGTIVKSGDLVFDVGVNLGQKSSIFLKLGARVVGVEPNPLCRPTLEYQFQSNPAFTLVPKALASSEGMMTLTFSGTSSTASLRKDWKWVGIEGECQEAEVEVTTLDRLIAEFGVPRFCKIDVEGFESEVLKGLGRSIPLISFEYHAEERERFEACLSQLSKLSDVSVNFIPIDGRHFVLREALLPSRIDFSRLPLAGDCFVWSSPKPLG